jgi:hypothetical protein
LFYLFAGPKTPDSHFKSLNTFTLIFLTIKKGTASEQALMSGHDRVPDKEAKGRHAFSPGFEVFDPDI